MCEIDGCVSYDTIGYFNQNTGQVEFYCSSHAVKGLSGIKKGLPIVDHVEVRFVIKHDEKALTKEEWVLKNLLDTHYFGLSEEIAELEQEWHKRYCKQRRKVWNMYTKWFSEKKRKRGKK